MSLSHQRNRKGEQEQSSMKLTSRLYNLQLAGLLLVVLALMPGATWGKDTIHVSKRICKSVENRIDDIQARMRSGYSSEAGERYREKLRKLKKQRRECDKKGYPTK